MPCRGVVVSKPVVFLYDPQGLLFTPSGFVICYIFHMLYFPDVFRRVHETPSPLRLLQLFDPCQTRTLQFLVQDCALPTNVKNGKNELAEDIAVKRGHW